MFPSIAAKRPSRNRCVPSSARKGATIVEFAIIIPVFLMIVLGIIEFGRAMLVSQMVANASREACRQAILDDSTNTAVETYVEDFLSTSLNIASTDVTVQCYVNDVLVDISTAEQSDKIKVRVEIPFNKVSLTNAAYLSGKNLSGETTMRHE